MQMQPLQIEFRPLVLRYTEGALNPLAFAQLLAKERMVGFILSALNTLAAFLEHGIILKEESFCLCVG
jgi:hypothetical protein